jgi:hypothetical protein
MPHSASVIQADLRREIMGHLGLAEPWQGQGTSIDDLLTGIE